MMEDDSKVEAIAKARAREYYTQQGIVDPRILRWYIEDHWEEYQDIVRTAMAEAQNINKTGIDPNDYKTLSFYITDSGHFGVAMYPEDFCESVSRGLRGLPPVSYVEIYGGHFEINGMKVEKTGGSP